MIICQNMKTLINKTQALQIAHSILTRQKGLDDYGFTAKREAAAIIQDLIELDKVEQELVKVEQPELPRETKSLTIADLAKNFKKN